MNKKQKKLMVVLCGSIILLALAVILIGSRILKNGDTVINDTPEVQDETDITNPDEEAAELLPEELEQYMTINLFPGFSGEDAYDVLGGSLSSSEVVLDYVGSYDGIFYEDGTNEEKEQVFSVIVTNISARTLEVMQLWIEDENGESYHFQVSALPSGGVALAQELSGKTFREDAKYRIVRDSFGFFETEDNFSELSISESDGKIYLTNNTENRCENVQVIYKNWLDGYAYLGGIAYRVTLDAIESGETLEITSDHYIADESKVTGIKRVQEEGEVNGTTD